MFFVLFKFSIHSPHPPPATAATTAPDPQVDSKDFALLGAPGAGGRGQGSDGAGGAGGGHASAEVKSAAVKVKSGAGMTAEDSAWDELDTLQKDARQVGCGGCGPCGCSCASLPSDHAIRGPSQNLRVAWCVCLCE